MYVLTLDNENKPYSVVTYDKRVISLLMPKTCCEVVASDALEGVAYVFYFTASWFPSPPELAECLGEKPALVV